MKKIAILAALFCAVLSFAQAPPPTAPPPDKSIEALHVVLNLPVLSRVQDNNVPSAWSIGGVLVVRSVNHKTVGTVQACAFNDFKQFTRKGKPTELYWGGYLGTTVDKDGHTAAGLGGHWMHAIFDQGYIGAFAGVSVQTGGLPAGFAIGLNVGIKF